MSGEEVRLRRGGVDVRSALIPLSHKKMTIRRAQVAHDQATSRSLASDQYQDLV